MYKLTIKETMKYDDAVMYSIRRKSLIPFEKEKINSSDNDYLAD
ncbi:hypothetical protein [Clostridium hydrogeniformans]|nr:hypothetical protein [Clostridium hydrogeniformans]